MPINQYPEIGDDAAVTLIDNDVGGSISGSMIFELHAVAVDDDIISVDTSVPCSVFLSTTFCNCRSVLLFSSHSLFFFP